MPHDLKRPDAISRDVVEAVRVVRSKETRVPEIALVLGSGLGDLADLVEDATVIPTHELPGYPPSTVAGHQGRLVFGRLEGREVVFVQGRVHLYEGHSVRAITFPIRLVYALGARRLLVTNAAGGIDPAFVPGTLMFITDQINFSFASPLAGPNEDGGPRFPDMSAPYDPEWLDRAERLALDLGIATRRGVYLWTKGPSYETKAEIKLFARLGADAVGMSTVPEVIQARYLGMPVLGISTITNPAAGLGAEPLAHDDVLDVGKRVRSSLQRLIRAIVQVT
ncbi:MAG: purine-nucleoside phosphorylase [Rhodothermales bacterium]